MQSIQVFRDPAPMPPLHIVLSQEDAARLYAALSYAAYPMSVVVGDFLSALRPFLASKMVREQA